MCRFVVSCEKNGKILMKMLSYSSIIVSCVVVFLTYWVCRFVNWIWLRPKKLEKCLRGQDFGGNPYTFLRGDQKESTILLKEAMSKPIKLSDDIKQRVIPHVLQTIKNHGVNSFMWEGRIPRIHITEPELIKQVLVQHSKFRKSFHDYDPITKLFQSGVSSLEGEIWANRRKILNTSFQFEKLKLMLPEFYSSSCNMVNKWESMTSNKGSAEVDAHREFEALTGDIIARTLFASNFQECEKIFELIRELVVLTVDVIRSIYVPGLRFLPTKRNSRMRKVYKEVCSLVMGIINRKMKALEGGGISNSSNLLGVLVEYNMNETKNRGETISIQNIIDECKLFYFAGQDTTSGLLSWTMVLLGMYPEWQERARKEILQVFGDSEPNYDDVNRLKIVSMILYEVLRLYPPVVELTKVAAEDIKLGELFIPAGVQVMLPTIILHHDPKIWGEDVKEFKPERFGEGVSKATKKQGTYFPFSLGPRVCIGQNYALLEAKMALSLILSRFSFELSPSYRHAPCTLFVMYPQFGLPLIVHKL